VPILLHVEKGVRTNMKKAITVIIAALYVVAIIIIAFFGSEVRTESKTTYVDDIVLTNETVIVAGKTIWEVNPNSNWDISKKDDAVKYTIIIRDYDYFYNQYGNTLELHALVKPANADHPTLNYSVVRGDDYSTISTDGKFSFNNKLTEMKASQVKISSTDGSLVSIKVGIVAQVVTA